MGEVARGGTRVGEGAKAVVGGMAHRCAGGVICHGQYPQQEAHLHNEQRHSFQPSTHSTCTALCPLKIWNIMAACSGGAPCCSGVKSSGWVLVLQGSVVNAGNMGGLIH